MPTHTGNVLSWATVLEDNTMEQAQRSAAMPFVERPLALMPDAHLGLGATVGSVIATHGAVIPAAVGVDIGCGMIAGRLNIGAEDLPDDLGALHTDIAEGIPAGIPSKADKTNGSHSQEQRMSSRVGPIPDYLDEFKVRCQHGTLGSGNHFVELCLDEADRVWVVLHSGSRGAGNKVARRHIDKAKGLMKRYFITLDDPDLSYFVQGTDEFETYIGDMLWAQDYAYSNRKAMLRCVVEAVRSHTYDGTDTLETINCHHNYTEQEHHHGKNLWITRKGAIRAREGDRGVIPGSMATGSFIVEGLGSAASYCSAAHGAGRTRSRKAARRELTTASLNQRMAGISWNDDAEALLDEHPEAYKDLGEVMDNQADLVRPTHRLTTILNFKGA